MTEWEYKFYETQKREEAGKLILESDLEAINHIGKDGWELVCFQRTNTPTVSHGFRYIFKKPIE